MVPDQQQQRPTVPQRKAAARKSGGAVSKISRLVYFVHFLF